MNRSTILRLRSKQEAKQRIAESFWASFCAGALYVMPVFALTLMTMMLPLQLESYPVWLDGVFYLADFLIVSPLAYGFGLYCVSRSRGEQASFFAVFEPMGSVHSYARALMVALSISIRVLPITAVRLLLIYAVPSGTALAPIIDLMISLGAALESVLRLSMTACYNFIADDPEIGSWRAVTLARDLYAKDIFSVVSFMISFLGWMFLAVLSMGLLLPYLVVYQSTAFARMTDLLRTPEPTPPEPGAPME